MARVVVQRNLLGNLDQREIGYRIAKFCGGRKMKVLQRSERDIHAKQGSQLVFRLLGTLFSKDEWMPKAAHIYWNPSQGGFVVNVSFEASFGMGYLDPYTSRRYQQVFEQLAQELQYALDAQPVG